jgi:stringent starvation protein B
MNSVTPYLVRAYHQWMEDSGLTPHILVDCSKPNVVAPKSFIQQGKIVLNIANHATNALVIDNESISFKVRFKGKSHNIYTPIDAVLTIYASENGEGMFFENTQIPPKKKSILTILE